MMSVGDVSWKMEINRGVRRTIVEDRTWGNLVHTNRTKSTENINN